MVIHIDDIQLFKNQALQWAGSFDVCCLLDSNVFDDPYSKFDFLIAAGVKDEIRLNAGSAFDQLEAFRNKNKGWQTGFLSYDLKNEVEELTSGNIDQLDFPDLYFFVPQHLICVKGNKAEIISDSEANILDNIRNRGCLINKPVVALKLQSHFDKTTYVKTVNLIKEHINRGNIYVTNFCQEFFAENATIDPIETFIKLNQISPNPFAAFFKVDDKYIISASPERFLAKRANKLISQPIKGTSARQNTIEADEISKNNLKADAKELQENVMIVDLVRNDLTKSAKPGTVITEELFGIYSFEQVHQMISTITCEIATDISAIKAIKNTFPMGSMTGAPKFSAMQLMEKYERTRRGVYSGAIGYFDPDDDFDFSVVIRTILYNSTSQYLSFQAGSAITFHAQAEKEYEECLLKIKAILEALAIPLNK